MKGFYIWHLVLLLSLLVGAGCATSHPQKETSTLPSERPASFAALEGFWRYDVTGSRFLSRGRLEFFASDRGLSGHLREEPTFTTGGAAGRGQRALPITIEFEEVIVEGSRFIFTGTGIASQGNRFRLRAEGVLEADSFRGRLSLEGLLDGRIRSEAAAIEAERIGTKDGRDERKVGFSEGC